MKRISSVLYLVVFLLSNMFGLSQAVFAQTPTPTPTPSSSQQELQQQIQNLEQEISNAQGQEKTLSSQIAVYDNQITLTQYKIDQTEEDILSVEEDIDTTQKKITSLNSSLQNMMQYFVSRVDATYQSGQEDPINLLLTSNSVDNFVTRTNYLKIVQSHDRQLILDTYQAKNDYSNQQNILEDKKKQIIALQSQLQDYNNQLDQQKKQKQTLLTQTQGSEAQYESLLAEARAQLAGFSNFVSSQGGASLLSGQTYCDGWGCYYSQRDSQWGDLVINGSNDCDGPCTIAKVGCLITSIAMVASHYGHRDILPSDIAVSGGGNFSVGTAGLRFSINVKGVSISRSGISRSDLDSVLASEPVIVGISYDGGPIADHFVVLKSGSGGNYTMDDPFTPNGHDIAFTSKYSLGSIVEIDRVSM